MSDAFIGVMLAIGVACVAFAYSAVNGFWEDELSFDFILKNPGDFFEDGEWVPIVHHVVINEAYIRACEMDSPNSIEFDRLLEKQEEYYWEILEKARAKFNARRT